MLKLTSINALEVFFLLYTTITIWNRIVKCYCSFFVILFTWFWVYQTKWSYGFRRLGIVLESYLMMHLWCVL